ncbi:hypothetical protein [Methylocaldum szegediense]|uniref:Lipoprotein n=1 Tax=Methylocaldum szegediense TaxID=73780 RepID=A0ABN8X5E9_9GAMM|nr:hypothetical protein [Methylocaldum szegediense]CAI8830422.1 protein of unknown function [Methylocaldum szegediense]
MKKHPGPPRDWIFALTFSVLAFCMGAAIALAACATLSHIARGWPTLDAGGMLEFSGWVLKSLFTNTKARGWQNIFEAAGYIAAGTGGLFAFFGFRFSDARAASQKRHKNRPN